MTPETLTYFAFGGYFIILAAITWVAYQSTHGLGDYVIGGRQLGPTAAALSAGASDMSGWLLMGLPGYAYASGLISIWLALGLFVGSLLNWIYVAPKLREQSFNYGNSITIPSFLENRFADQTGLLRIISALLILAFFTFYSASGLAAGGKLFTTVFGLEYQTAVIVGAVAVLLYTLIGGFLAVSWTDVFQGLLMLAALALVPVMIFAEPNLDWEKVSFSFLGEGSEALSFIAILSLVAWGLGYFGQPHILARFMALKSPEQAGQARNIAVTWTGLTLLLGIVVGLAGRAFLQGDLDDSERVFMVLVEALFHPSVAGLLLAAILAAVMSTADSQLLVASSALSEDFLRKTKLNLSESQLLMAGRAAVVVIAIIAAVIALDEKSKVLDMVAYAWAGFGATFGPVILFSLYSNRVTAMGAMGAMVVGAVTVVVWKQMSGGIFDLYEILPGFILASLVLRLTFSPKQAQQLS